MADISNQINERSDANIISRYTVTDQVGSYDDAETITFADTVEAVQARIQDRADQKEIERIAAQALLEALDADCAVKVEAKLAQSRMQAAGKM